MSSSLESVTVQALNLTPDERAELIYRLIASIEPAKRLHPAWQEKIERRIADTDAGRTIPIPGEEVFARIRAKIAAHGRKG